MRFTPSSTARLRTLSAPSRSFGQPQMPSPVIRMAPNPRRFTERSPPILKVSLIFFVDSAPNNGAAPTTDNPTPPARLNLTNLRRSILFSMEQGRSPRIGVKRLHPHHLVRPGKSGDVGGDFVVVGNLVRNEPGAVAIFAWITHSKSVQESDSRGRKSESPPLPKAASWQAEVANQFGIGKDECALSSGRPRSTDMAGKKTMHPQRKPRVQGARSRKGENIQSGGQKVGVMSGAKKSLTTRAARRFGGMRSDAR